MPSQPPNLYLDHSAFAREDRWPIIAPAVSAGDVRLAFSLWNLVAIGDATDLAQRERRLTFIEQNSPLWIVERVGVQRQEVRRFLWTNRFGAPAEELCVFTPHLSVVDGYLAGVPAQVGLTARSFIARTDFSAIAEKKKLAPVALSTLQAVGKKAFKARQRDIFKAWIQGLIPTADPDGKLFTATQRGELLDYCEAHREQFLASCRALAVEDAMIAARTADPRRKPQNSDGIDLMHAVIALAYCHHFLVRDGFVKTCAAQATKALAPMSLARVYDDAAPRVRDLKPSLPAAPSAPSPTV